jgi:hypothetical protein
MNRDSLNEMKQKHQCRTYLAEEKSWDGSDDDEKSIMNILPSKQSLKMVHLTCLRYQFFELV